MTAAQAAIQELVRNHDAVVQRKRKTIVLGALIFAAAVFVAGILAEISFSLFAENIHRFPNYISRIFTLDSGPYAGWLVLFDPVGWYWGLWKWTKLLIETIIIAYVATIAGVVGGFFLCFLAAGNVGNSAWVVYATRRVLEFFRTVPELVFALIFVMAFGLGPIAGVLAIMIHTMGALGKLFFEVVENADQKPLEGLTASGATWVSAMRFSILPQVLPSFVSYSLLRFEINVRGAAIMGFVGAGGIGQDLIAAVRKFYYPDISAILIMIVITVGLIDFGTEKLRHRFIDGDERK